ncbi:MULTISPECIES: hypothetical protein [Flavobacterium]|uniref:Secreted protein n=1 Tax=Flavobacterium jumunjinense TaxID=998845 RepID=A0ABV5GNU7_9FLAO|nr:MULTISPECIES: hypothetical protein [Flavobacterium]
MKTIMILQKMTADCMFILISTCTNDLVVNAKQVNYFEMFMLSFAIECKNTVMKEKPILKDTVLKLYKDCQKSCKTFFTIAT